MPRSLGRLAFGELNYQHPALQVYPTWKKSLRYSQARVQVKLMLQISNQPPSASA